METEQIPQENADHQGIYGMRSSICFKTLWLAATKSLTVDRGGMMTVMKGEEAGDTGTEVEAEVGAETEVVAEIVIEIGTDEETDTEVVAGAKIATEIVIAKNAARRSVRSLLQ